MFKSIRKWIHASRTRRIGAAALGLAMLVCGAVLVWDVFFVSPPDPIAASDEQVVEFLASERYGRMSTKQRDEFLRSMSTRLNDMSPQQRRDFDELWRSAGQDERIRQKINAQMYTVYIRRTAEQYSALPANERGPFLDRILMAVYAIGPSGGQFLEWLDTNPLDGAMRDPSDFASNPLKRELIMGTSADERAQLVKFGGDLLIRHKRR